MKEERKRQGPGKSPGHPIGGVPRAGHVGPAPALSLVSHVISGNFSCPDFPICPGEYYEGPFHQLVFCLCKTPLTSLNTRNSRKSVPSTRYVSTHTAQKAVGSHGSRGMTRDWLQISSNILSRDLHSLRVRTTQGVFTNRGVQQQSPVFCGHSQSAFLAAKNHLRYYQLSIVTVKQLKDSE